MLRRRYFDFVDAYRQEVVDAIRAAVNSCVTEIVARSESDHHGSASEHQSLDNQLKFLTVEEWIQLMRIVAVALSHLVKRIKVGLNHILVISILYVKRPLLFYDNSYLSLDEIVKKMEKTIFQKILMVNEIIFQAAHDVMKEAVEVSRRKTSLSDKRYVSISFMNILKCELMKRLCFLAQSFSVFNSRTKKKLLAFIIYLIVFEVIKKIFPSLKKENSRGHQQF